MITKLRECCLIRKNEIEDTYTFLAAPGHGGMELEGELFHMLFEEVEDPLEDEPLPFLKERFKIGVDLNIRETDQYKELLALNRELVRVLKICETDTETRCPVCGAENYDHKLECDLGAVLEEARLVLR